MALMAEDVLTRLVGAEWIERLSIEIPDKMPH